MSKPSIKYFGIPLALVMAFALVTPIHAIENGELADGSEYVVPISIQATSNTWQSCSGAVIAPTVIATAGHCVLDKSGLLSSQILVGNPGSANSPSTSWVKVSKIYVADEYKGSSADGLITASDIAFLLLEKAIGNSRKINLTSENELLSLKNASSKLRIIGYGNTSDSGATSPSPFSLDATFSKQVSQDPNQAIAVSQKANICKGDSGSPILSITPSKVTLVGVVTGAYSSNFCSKKQADGNYWTAFTAVSRFANLATEAITDSLKLEQSQNSANQNSASENQYLTSRLEELELEVSTAINELERLKEELAKSNRVIAAFAATGMKAINCSNLVSTKIVVGKSPKCPKGYKKEK